MSWLFFFFVYVFIVRVVNFKVLCIRARIIWALNYFRHFSDMIFFSFLSCNSVLIVVVIHCNIFMFIFMLQAGSFSHTYSVAREKKRLSKCMFTHMVHSEVSHSKSHFETEEHSKFTTHKSNEEPIRFVCLYFMEHFHAMHKNLAKIGQC